MLQPKKKKKFFFFKFVLIYVTIGESGNNLSGYQWMNG